MATPTESGLMDPACRHARRLQWLLLAATLALDSVGLLSLWAIQAAAEALGYGYRDYGWLLLVVHVAMVSIFASWSAVWIVLGCGTWWSRLLITLAIFHLAFVLGLMVITGLGVIFNQFSFNSDWRGPLGSIAGSSYAFAGQLLASTFVVWMLKLFRFRLLYFDDATSYPHPRALCRGVPPAERTGVKVLSGRVHLVDMFVLTTLVAVYLAAWYPIFEIALSDDRMFGAQFIATILILVLGTGAAIGLAAVLIPLLATMLDHYGRRFQIIFHSIESVTTLAAMGIVLQQPAIDDAEVALSVGAVLCCFAFQVLLYSVMHRPTKWFRFRLVRLPVMQALH